MEAHGPDPDDPDLIADSYEYYDSIDDPAGTEGRDRSHAESNEPPHDDPQPIGEQPSECGDDEWNPSEHLEPIDVVEGTLAGSFSEIAEETLIALAVPATLLLHDLQNPVGLNLVGPPSSGKTTIASFFDGLPELSKTVNPSRKTPLSSRSPHGCHGFA